MNLAEKQTQLKKHKAIALCLLLLMAMIYIATYFILTDYAINGYIRAFSEAAMVGALADWFAVTALFRHPLGLRIPHTNIIKNNQQKIGDNLGGFVTNNFLTPENIRPRIEKLLISKRLGLWLQKKAHREVVIREINRIAGEALAQIDDPTMSQLISRRAQDLLGKMNPSKVVGNVLNGIVNNGFHEEWITLLSKQGANYIGQNYDLVEEKVQSESHILIPDFVDEMIAGKITKGIQKFFLEIANNPQHPQRKQITQKLKQLAENISQKEGWTGKFSDIKNHLLTPEKTKEYAGQIWQYLKDYLLDNLNQPHSDINRYLDKTLINFGNNFLHSREKGQKLDQFVQVQVFKLILRHREEASRLISTTVSRWDSQSLSDKLELEVGKDLQFIRFNGTLIGGLVGLLIYLVTQLALKMG